MPVTEERGARGPAPGPGPRAAPEHRRARHGQADPGRRRPGRRDRRPDRARAARCGARSPSGSPTPWRRWPASTSVDVELTVMTEAELGAVRAKMQARQGGARRARPRRARPAASGSGTRRAGPTRSWPATTAPGSSASARARAASASRRSPSTWPSPWPSRATRSASSTPTSTASRCPRMLGIEHDPVVIDDMIVPPVAYGVRCISIGFFVGEDQPVMWRGPDAAQGARAVPGRRVLGRPRLPARRHAAGHRRRRPVDGPVPAALGGLRRHHARRRPPSGWPSAPPTWPRRSTCPLRGVIENMSLVHRRRRPALRAVRRGAAASGWPPSSACRCSARSRWCRRSGRAATWAGR